MKWKSFKEGFKLKLKYIILISAISFLVIVIPTSLNLKSGGKMISLMESRLTLFWLQLVFL